jgi:hypothetical protein
LFPFGIVTHILNKDVKNKKYKKLKKGKKKGCEGRRGQPAAAQASDLASPHPNHLSVTKKRKGEFPFQEVETPRLG